MGSHIIRVGAKPFQTKMIANGIVGKTNVQKLMIIVSLLISRHSALPVNLLMKMNCALVMIVSVLCTSPVGWLIYHKFTAGMN